ncbi:MAG: hypothetical protein JNM18_21435 [Planctomycetaceae bacterium]|nr:hypothetical protein [Planctomycetaceae bacterium]
MILAYGSYRHALAETGIAIQRETQFATNGVPRALRERWRIDGVLQAESPEMLTRAIHELQHAYSRHAQDLTLYLPDGTTPTAHVILSRDTIGGVRVARPPSFPQGRGAEYSTYRSYTIELEADLPVSRETNLLLRWEEVLTFAGGGPRWVYLATLAGPPVRQQVQESTPYRATQSGRAVGLREYPTPAAPIWLAAWHQDTSTITRRLPRRVGSGAAASETDFEVTWLYQFESASPLVAQPSRS